MLTTHRVRVKDGAAVAGVQALIELRLRPVGGTRVELAPEGGFAVYFNFGPHDLDFLRPHVLPPL